MNQNPLNCARYWRNSLADAELGRGTFRNTEIAALIRIDGAALLRGQADAKAVAALFSGSHAEVESRTITLRPLTYRARTVHGRLPSRLPEVLTPIVSRVTLFSDGRLTLPTNTVVPRDLLEPLDRNALTIGTVEGLDSFLTQFGKSDGTTWPAYRQYCDRLAQAVFPGLAGDGRFERVDSGFLQARGQPGASRLIGSLYEQMENDRVAPPLFSTFASRPLTKAEPCLEPNSAFAARLGHSSPLYALSEAQRNAITHLLAAEHGDVVTVNGPPGTGKTTLLLSVVASLWAKAALDQNDAPIIFASSTNNQAVTNIIDAFGADFSKGGGLFAGRWLPRPESFACYFPARSRKVPDTYLTQAFFITWRMRTI